MRRNEATLDRSIDRARNAGTGAAFGGAFFLSEE